VQRAGSSVKVTLRIPVKRNNEYITFERIYYDGRQLDEFRNEGAVIELQFGVTIFPFIKLNDPTLRPFYRVQLIDRNITGNLMNTRCELRFFSNENQREVESTCRNRSRKPDASSHYYVLDQEFDYIQFQNSFASGVSGIIIPKWRTYQSGNKIFHFAVDFGTTNTHIEYKVGNNVSQPFNITDADMQVATLFHPTETSEDFGGTGAIAIGELIDYEFVPQRIGDDAEYKFPQRTVIAVSNQLNINDQNNTVLADFNIPFVYEKKPERDKIHSNLKWSEMNPESKQIPSKPDNSKSPSRTSTEKSDSKISALESKVSELEQKVSRISSSKSWFDGITFQIDIFSIFISFILSLFLFLILKGSKEPQSELQNYSQEIARQQNELQRQNQKIAEYGQTISQLQDKIQQLESKLQEVQHSSPQIVVPVQTPLHAI